MLLLIHTIPARSENCSNVDLRDKFGPVRNQDGVGWCYSFAAADMIGFKNNGRARVSAAELVQQYMSTPILKSQTLAVNTVGQYEYINTYKDASDKYRGGQVHEILKLAANKGVCLEKDIPSELNGGPTINEAYSQIIGLTKHVKHNSRYVNNCIQASSYYRNFFPRLSVREIQSAMNTAAYQGVISKLQAQSCKTRYAADFQASEVGFESRDKQKMAQIIRSQLDANKPVAIGYRIGLIMNHANPNGGHGSVLVGRRKNRAGACEYLIRNSYGRSCDGYKNPSKCNQGNIWVTEKDLFESMLSATYFM